MSYPVNPEREYKRGCPHASKGLAGWWASSAPSTPCSAPEVSPKLSIIGLRS